MHSAINIGITEEEEEEEELYIWAETL